jgi:hypothetical protein
LRWITPSSHPVLLVQVTQESNIETPSNRGKTRTKFALESRSRKREIQQIQHDEMQATRRQFSVRRFGPRAGHMGTVATCDFGVVCGLLCDGLVGTTDHVWHVAQQVRVVGDGR